MNFVSSSYPSTRTSVSSSWGRMNYRRDLRRFLISAAMRSSTESYIVGRDFRRRSRSSCVTMQASHRLTSFRCLTRGDPRFRCRRILTTASPLEERRPVHLTGKPYPDHPAQSGREHRRRMTTNGPADERRHDAQTEREEYEQHKENDDEGDRAEDHVSSPAALALN